MDATDGSGMDAAALPADHHHRAPPSDDAERLRTFQNALACGILVLNPHGEVIEVNASAEAFLGLSREHLHGRRLEDALAGSSWQAIREDGSPLAHSERPSLMALRTRQAQQASVLGLRRPDGTTHWLHIDAMPILGADGQPELIVANFIDITARIEALRQRHEFDQAAAQLTSNYTYAFSLRPDGTVVRQWTTGAFTRLTGFTYEEIEARGWDTLAHPEDRAQFGERWAAIRSGQADVREYRIITKTGDTRWVQDAILPVADPATGGLRIYGATQDITERKRAGEAVQHYTLHDTLTDLPNRTLLQDRLEQAVRTAQREGKSVALLLLDLDRFKEVNNTLGHQVGDRLLQQVSARLRGVVRASDTIARLGGDEFAVILPASGTAGSEWTAHRILQAIRRPFLLEEDQRLDIDASIGIVLAPTQGTDAPTLLRRAAIALYVAKRAESGYAVYDPADDHHSPARLGRISALRDAIAADQLLLHFQPKVHLQKGTFSGVEALVRWQHPQQGLIPPDHFIPLAEQSGLNTPLSQWVLEAALRQCRRWKQSGLAVDMAVNLSMRSLQELQFPQLLGGLLRRWSLAPSSLTLEITESTLMANPERALTVLGHLADLGVRLSIDDFGTGYSSLAYLKRLPVHEVKIDRSFIVGAGTDPKDTAIVQSIITLGHQLHLNVVAEGIEDRAAWVRVVEMGCDLGQGYFLSRPLPAQE